MAWLILKMNLLEDPTQAVKAIKRESQPWLEEERGLRAATLLVNSEAPQQGELWLRFHSLPHFQKSRLAGELQEGKFPSILQSSSMEVTDKPKLLYSPEIS